MRADLSFQILSWQPHMSSKLLKLLCTSGPRPMKRSMTTLDMTRATVSAQIMPNAPICDMLQVYIFLFV